MKKELTALLKELGFQRKKMGEEHFAYFLTDKRYIILPRGRLHPLHYLSIRTHLDAWGLVDRVDFTKQFIDVLPM